MSGVRIPEPLPILFFSSFRHKTVNGSKPKTALDKNVFVRTKEQVIVMSRKKIKLFHMKPKPNKNSPKKCRVTPDELYKLLYRLEITEKICNLITLGILEKEKYNGQMMYTIIEDKWNSYIQQTKS